MEGAFQAVLVAHQIVDQIPLDQGHPLREGQRHVAEVEVVRASDRLEAEVRSPDELGAEELVPRGRIERQEDLVAHLLGREGELLWQVGDPHRPVGAGHRAGALIHGLELRDHDVRGVGARPSVELLQQGRREAVVGVEDGQILSGRQVKADVAGGAGAARPRPADPSEPGVGGGEFGDDVGGAVGGRVIDHDDLDVEERLGGDARQGLGQPGLPVPNRHDHRDCRRLGVSLRQHCRPAPRPQLGLHFTVVRHPIRRPRPTRIPHVTRQSSVESWPTTRWRIGSPRRHTLH